MARTAGLRRCGRPTVHVGSVGFAAVVGAYGHLFAQDQAEILSAMNQAVTPLYACHGRGEVRRES